MEKQFKGVIFDLDGTIIDSMGMWRTLDREFITGQGIEYDPAISKAIVGMTLEEAAGYFCKALNLPKTPKQVTGEWREYLLNQYKHSIPLKKGAAEIIEKWHKQGVKMCIATLTEKEMATIILEKYGLLDKMEFVLTVYEAGKSKLFPDIYLQCADKMGFKPEDCLVLEDTCHAIKTAKAAGFTVYAVHEDTSVYMDEIKTISHEYLKDFTDLL